MNEAIIERTLFPVILNETINKIKAVTDCQKISNIRVLNIDSPRINWDAANRKWIPGGFKSNTYE